MAETDEDALICDFAEYYHIYDYKQIPTKLAAILAWGLPDNSRIRKQIAGVKVDLDKLLLAGVLDRLSLLVWAQTKDGQKGKNRPQPMVEILIGKKESDNMAFSTVAEFEKARKELIKEIEGA